jgi:hypothetical protein
MATASSAGLVGQLHVQRPGIGLGEDRDGLDAHALGRADDPAGDLAPVGDQDLVEHLASLASPKAGSRLPRAPKLADLSPIPQSMG